MKKYSINNIVEKLSFKIANLNTIPYCSMESSR